MKQSCTRRARDAVAFMEEERQWPVSAHAFRHTFGTQATAYPMPIEGVVMGHMSLETTSIYVQAEKNA